MSGPDSRGTRLVRIRDAGGAVVGSGLHLGDARIITCAHVVADATGGEARPGASIAFDLPFVDERLRTATVVESRRGRG